MWLPLFGVFFSIALGCPELCLDVSLICMIVGGPLVGQGVLGCGKWCLHASFGVYGRKGIIEILRIGRVLCGIFFLCYLKLCIFGRRRMCFLCQLVLVIFFLVLPFLVRLFRLYTSRVLMGVSRFQWDWFYYLYEEKKKLVYKCSETDKYQNNNALISSGNMQVQNPHNIKYNGTLQGLKYIWRTEGLRGLFKGNGTNCARIVPNSAVKFFSYEQASE
jgi:hypothetical protein